MQPVMIRESATKTRLMTVDIVKGIAILLMVFGHTVQGGLHRHWWEGPFELPRKLEFVDAFIYSFHMPAFFVIGGLFLSGSVKRSGRSGVLLTKTKTILYPYVLWSLIMAFLTPLIARFESSPHVFSWKWLFLNILTGNVSWFLPTFFLCQVLALILFPLPLITQMILALAASMLVPASSVVVFYKPFLFFTFVVAGIWMGGGRLKLLEQMPKWGSCLLFALFLMAQLSVVYYFGPVNTYSMFPIGIAGVVMLFLISHALDETVLGKVLAWFGEGSLAIFLLAAFGQGFAREVIFHYLHSISPLLQLTLPVITASVIPILLWQYRDRWKIGWMFRWPQS